MGTSSDPNVKSPKEEFTPPLGFYEKCSIMDEIPLAYCVIELVFDEDGHGVDFIFRYCNKEMTVVEGVPVEEMLNRSFYEVFRNGDRKWLVSYADVALNGTKHTLKDFSPEIGKTLPYIAISQSQVSAPASCCQNECTHLNDLSLKCIVQKNKKGSDQTNFRSAQSL